MIVYCYVREGQRRSPIYPRHRPAKIAHDTERGDGHWVGPVVGLDRHDHQVTVHEGVPTGHAPGSGRWHVREAGRVVGVTRTLAQAERLAGRTARARAGRVNLLLHAARRG